MTDKETFRLLVELPWIIFVIYWIVGAIKTRATRESESAASRIAILLIEIAGYVLIFSDSAGIGFLGTRFMPRTWASAILGVVLTWSGIGLAIWARYHLAEYWSARITIKEDHQLIRTGPVYSFAAPDLFRPGSGDDRLGPGHRQVAMCPGCMPGADWLLLQSNEGRNHA